MTDYDSWCYDIVDLELENSSSSVAAGTSWTRSCIFTSGQEEAILTTSGCQRACVGVSLAVRARMRQRVGHHGGLLLHLRPAEEQIRARQACRGMQNKQGCPVKR